ncbi:MAG: Hsp70 family protein, partial [Deltaproteobacteria bacterium]|nr:Hsp70 family protein [Deltaproteobacteria bacterium]
MSDQRYIIGIDLGTTNCAVSYVDLLQYRGARPKIEIFPVSQLTGPGEILAQRLLPSFLYMPGEHEIAVEATTLPWRTDGEALVGAFARDQGALVPKRMVSSAKSWLCHGRVDRRGPILPWGAAEDQLKLSPVAATAAYLRHIKDAWNHARAGDEDQFFENQTVIITVPASFDEVARDLTLEAAGQAGLKGVTLLEEPLAAFYTWLFLHEGAWDQYIRPGALVLVCDVGGGTTDFTLIALRDKQGKPGLERIAVGDHLILGGDNMDLALARRLEMGLRKDKNNPLKVHVWQSLCQQCRRAKEEILGGAQDSQIITLVGEGRRLIADTVSASLERRDVEETILEGFYPFVEPGEDLGEKPRKGITEFGLPYAQDPAITRQMIRFLEHQKEQAGALLERSDARPDLVLFNGGSLKPQAVQERLRAAIRRWFGEEDESLPGVLNNSDLDLAVALGASYYGLVRKGHGVRVSSGSARAYYLGVGGGEQGDPPDDTPEKALCLVERGMEEGQRIRLEDKEFQVLTNQPVGFDLYSSSFRTGDRIGDVVTVDESLTAMPPIRTVIQFGKKAGRTSLPVEVEAHYTEVGT